MTSEFDLAAMSQSAHEATRAFERFGQAAAAAAFVIEREFVPVARAFTSTETIEITNAGAFRRQLRLRRDRKNWRTK